MARADTGHASRENLAALLHELRKNVGALIVDEVHLLDAKLADFLFAEILALAAARATWTAGASPRTAFAARTAVAAMTTAWTAMSSASATRTTFRAGCGSALGAACAWCARSAGSLRFLFVCHTCLPFTYEPALAGSLKIVSIQGPSNGPQRLKPY